MNQTENLIKSVEQYGAHNYHPLRVMLSRGEGAKVWDVDGKEYLDFLACYSALNFGHQHPHLVETMIHQVKKLAVCSRAFFSEELSHFSEELAKACGLEVVLPMNTGTEAVETALKLARKWGYERKGVPEGKAKIIAMANGFHGRTITVLAFSTESLYTKGFGPFTPGFEVVPFGDLSALEKAFDENTVGVLVEPIQAEAGILIPPDGYLRAVKALCQKNSALLMVDEIQTGMARTGKDFCYEYENTKPDLLILGKSLGGGLLPLSAVVGNHAVLDVIRPGQHGSTFGGNPLACAIGREAMKLLRTERLAEKALQIGKTAITALKAQPLPKVKEVRGRGALIGIELDPAAGGARRYCEALATAGVLCKETHDHVIRIAPPLVITQSDLGQGLDKIIQVIRKMG